METLLLTYSTPNDAEGQEDLYAKNEGSQEHLTLRESKTDIREIHYGQIYTRPPPWHRDLPYQAPPPRLL